ncbi:MAG: hypothetical protein WDK96_00555 [Candidatus Paceibacterota bacterium]|jgi:hypothetical protein
MKICNFDLLTFEDYALFVLLVILGIVSLFFAFVYAKRSLQDNEPFNFIVFVFQFCSLVCVILFVQILPIVWPYILGSGFVIFTSTRFYRIYLKGRWKKKGISWEWDFTKEDYRKVIQNETA